MDASLIKPDDVIYYAAVSLDGFIADKDGDVTWLDGFFIPELGFHDFITRVGGLIMGRRTFDKIAGFGKWPYGGLKGTVATHRDMDASFWASGEGRRRGERGLRVRKSLFPRPALARRRRRPCGAVSPSGHSYPHRPVCDPCVAGRRRPRFCQCTDGKPRAD
jgi:hypothetical protein